MNDTSSVLDKIKKLLATANGTSFEHEAEQALLAAQRLAMKHDIDLATIKDFASTTRNNINIVRDKQYYGARFPIVAPWARKIVEFYFDVKVIWGGTRAGGRYNIFIGPEDKVPTAICIYNFLVDAMQNGWAKYYGSQHHRLNHTPIGMLKTGYYNGFYAGLSQKLEAGKKQIEREFLTDSTAESAYALVRTTVEEAIDKFTAVEFPKLRTEKEKIKPSDYASYQVGHKDGRETTIARAYVSA